MLKLAVEILLAASLRSAAWLDRQHSNSQYSGLTSDAVGMAVEYGASLGDAARLLNSGRSVFYGHRLDIRSQLEGLPDILPTKYEGLRRKLDVYQLEETLVLDTRTFTTYGFSLDCD